MAKVKNRRDNHELKRPKSSAGYGESAGTASLKSATKSAGKSASQGKSAGSGKSASKSGAAKSGGSKTTGRSSSSAKSTGAKSTKSGASKTTYSAAHKDTQTKSYKDGKFRGFTGDREAYETEENPNIIIGRNPVTEALKSGREVDKLLVTSREGSMIKILAMAKDAGIPVMYVEKAALDRISGGKAHQGVAAYISPYDYGKMEDIFARADERGEQPFIVILDGIEDPHNLGAIMRTAECAGVHGIIIPKRHACGLTEVVAKASAGAIEYMPVVKVTNIAQTVEELKEKGVWVYACDMGGPAYYDSEMKGAVAVVIGSEGFGISKLVKEKCDGVVSMPMVGKITSLNASNAAAIIIYEVRKQRDTAI